MVTYIDRNGNTHAYGETDNSGNRLFTAVITGDEPDLYTFLSAHRDDDSILSHISSYSESEPVMDSNVPRSYSRLERSMNRVIGRPLTEAVAGIKFSLIRNGILRTVINDTVTQADTFIRDGTHADITQLPDRLTRSAIHGGIVAGLADDTNIFYGKRFDHVIHRYEGFRELYDGMAAVAVKEYLKGCSVISGIISHGSGEHSHIPSLRQLADMRRDSSIIHAADVLPENIYRMLNDHNGRDGFHRGLLCGYVSQDCSMDDIFCMGDLAADMILLDDNRPDIFFQTASTDPESRDIITGYLDNVRSGLEKYIDLPFTEAVSYLYDRELDAFDREHPAHSIIDIHGHKGFMLKDGIQEGFAGITDDAGRHYGLIDIPADMLYPRDPDYINRNHGYIVERIYDAAGISRYVRDAADPDDRKAVARLDSRLKQIDCRMSRYVEDGIGEAHREDFLQGLDDFAPDQRKDISERILKMNDTEFTLLLDSGFTATGMYHIIKDLPKDSHGIPHYNAYMRDFLHDIHFDGIDKDNTDTMLKELRDFPNLIPLMARDKAFMDTVKQFYPDGMGSDKDKFHALDLFASDLVSRMKPGLAQDTVHTVLHDLHSFRDASGKSFMERSSDVALTDGLIKDIARYHSQFIHATFTDVPEDTEKELDSLKDGISRRISDAIDGRPDEDVPYTGDRAGKLSGLFHERFHFVPRILPMLLTVTEGGYIDRTHKGYLPPERVAEDFNRHRISQIAPYANPAMLAIALECPMERLTAPVRDMLYAYAAPDNTEAVIENFDLLASKKDWNMQVLKELIGCIKIFDRDSLEKLSTMSPDEIKAISEKNMARNDTALYEKTYGYSILDNTVEIPGKDITAEDPARHLKAYILAPDDYRNITAGYDTCCCQHFEGAGETCTMAATSEPQSGIWIIENTDTHKIEAQAWVYNDTEKDTFVFDNIEFANDQKVADYKDLLFSYCMALPERNVHMGTGYNMMTNIGSPIKDEEMAEIPLCDCYGTYDTPYTDYNDKARVLKRNGEMSDRIPDSSMIIAKEKILPRQASGYEMIQGELVDSHAAETAFTELEKYKRYRFTHDLACEDRNGYNNMAGHDDIEEHGYSLSDTAEKLSYDACSYEASDRNGMTYSAAINLHDSDDGSHVCVEISNTEQKEFYGSFVSAFRHDVTTDDYFLLDRNGSPIDDPDGLAEDIFREYEMTEKEEDIKDIRQENDDISTEDTAGEYDLTDIAG